MIRHRSIVLPHGQKPAAQNLEQDTHGGDKRTGCNRFTVASSTEPHIQYTCFIPAHLVVNFKLLHNTKFQKHPQ